MELEVRHDDGGGEAKRDHEGAERGTEPAERSMHADVVRAHERRLKDEEEYPGREGRGMNPEDGGARYVCVQEVPVDRAAEPGNDERHGEQRHRKVEVFVDEAVAAGDCMGRPCGDGLRR